jgi:hypothetical protein
MACPSPTYRSFNASTQTPTNSKYDSRDFSGSVFLISSDGRMLRLPIPTRSPRDPLNWSKMKKARAFSAIFVFNVVGLVLIEGPSLMLESLKLEFSEEVRRPSKQGVYDWLIWG